MRRYFVSYTHQTGSKWGFSDMTVTMPPIREHADLEAIRKVAEDMQRKMGNPDASIVILNWRPYDED